MVDMPDHKDSGSAAGNDVSRQILRISLSRLTRLAAELANKRDGRLPVQKRLGVNNSGPVAIRANETSSYPPLFLVHPVGGSVLAYYHLAKYLRAEQSVYAIENQVVLNPEARLSSTIAEMAASYIEEIQEVCPNGPFLLGGYSMGGLVAFEIARELMARTQEVRFLALIDTPARIGGTSESSSGDSAVTPQDLITMAVVIAKSSEVTLNISAQELESAAPDQRLDYLLEALKKRNIVPPHVDAALFRDLVAIIRNNEQAQRRYVPQHYAGPLDLFRAADLSAELQREAGGLYQDPSFGWQAVCSEPVMVNYVPGSHMRMLDQPHVRELGASIQRRLDRELRKRAVNLH
jgi:thioesterase domain-containing protein